MTVAQRREPGPVTAVAAVCGEVLAEERLRPPRLAVLRAEDAARGTAYLPTLAAYFDSFGNVVRAAAVLGVHANTFRYRLRRLVEVSGLDLGDPGERLLCRLALTCPPPPARAVAGPATTTAVAFAAAAPATGRQLAALVAQSLRECGPVVPAGAGPFAHATVPLTGDPVPAAAGRAVLAAAAALGVAVRAATGPAVPAADAAASRRLAVLALRAGRPGVTAFEQVRTEATFVALRDALRRVPPVDGGGVARLAAHDAARRTAYRATLRAYLDAHGDVATAAAAVYIHPKTFRYRLRRIEELSGLSLDDPGTRLATELELRLRRPATGPDV
ncbi:MAG TPA: helix-turn-helix domain-containing protein [Mycobacteriales bacterium]|jgi:DNA-binding PucR family transcriptional regulator|nr:helix-turn-helix domain-containing protein [Mycobacteriales bacterium]